MRVPFLVSLLSAACLTVADLTWPSPSDELEEIVYQLHGFRGRLFADLVTPCSNQVAGPGRQIAAAWVRAGFHDMSTANVYTGKGGLDASLQFELNDGENHSGQTFNNTLRFFSDYLSTRTSISDLIAAGVYAGVRACGGPAVPLRTGRVDATVAGPPGVPQPQNSQYTFINQYDRFGFNVAQMIQLTACGHTLGGVHSDDFPEIVPSGSTTDGEAPFDTTSTVFDNKVVTQFLSWNTTNPLVVGPSVRIRRNSDTKVFTAQRSNLTLLALADPNYFHRACQTMLQKMIDTVPADVSLSSIPLAPYMVKPVAMRLTLDDSPSTLTLSGYIRVKTTNLPVDDISSVTLQWKDRDGGRKCGRARSCSTTATLHGVGTGFDDTFGFFPIRAKIDARTGISSFIVTLNLRDGGSLLYDNNGETYPMTDAILLQTPQSCLLQGPGNLTATALVRNDRLDMPVELHVSYLVPRPISGDGNPVPAIQSASIDMTRGACVGAYTFYSASYLIKGGLSHNARLTVTSGSGGDVASDSFRAGSELAGTCLSYTGSAQCSVGQASTSMSQSVSSTTSKTSTSISTAGSSASSSIPVTTGPSTSTTSSTTSITSITSTTATNSTTASSSSPSSSVPTRPKVANYVYVSCWTEGSNGRALSGASYSSNDMTLESCAKYCAPKYTYFGTEYSRECYCGEELAPGTTQAPQSQCNMPCDGNKTQSCGGSGRLDLYELDGVAPAPSTQPGTVGSYTFGGCMTESAHGRALSLKSYSSDNMTLENCASFCTGLKYFGAEYGRECYCGDSLSASVSASLAECSMSCSGNSSEVCGGSDRLSVYVH